jgi:putative oxidoreductase
LPQVNLITRLARPMLGAIFVYGGIDAARNPGAKVAKADALMSGAPAMVPGISSTEQLVRVDGAAKVLGGLALGLGIFPRLAAVGLAASLVPTTLAGHRFWDETDPAQRKAQQLQFVKNVSILGGVLLVAFESRRPSD